MRFLYGNFNLRGAGAYGTMSLYEGKKRPRPQGNDKRRGAAPRKGKGDVET